MSGAGAWAAAEALWGEIVRRGCGPGGGFVEIIAEHLTAYADARVAEAVGAENETCAQIVEAFDDDANDGRLREAAARIRAHRAPAAGGGEGGRDERADV